MEVERKKPGRRVFKKASPNGKLMLYLGRRDFYERDEGVDGIDGMVTLDDSYLRGRKVFAKVAVKINLNNAPELDSVGVGGGAHKPRSIYSEIVQVYPPSQDEPLTPLQKKLQRKLGEGAYPFVLQPPKGAPSSVAMRTISAGEHDRSICGVEWAVVIYVGQDAMEKRRVRSSIQFSIRKLSLAPTAPLVVQPPLDETAKRIGFVSAGAVSISCKLLKEVYAHGEPITVQVDIHNESHTAVKNVALKVRQFSTIRSCKGTAGTTLKAELYKQIDQEDFPLKGNSKLSKTYTLTPTLRTVKKNTQVALDGAIHDEDTGLASSTQLTHANPLEDVGIFVMYDIKIKAHCGFLNTVVAATLPFVLATSRPDIRKVSVNIPQGGLPGSPAVSDDPFAAFDEVDRMLEGANGGLDLVFEEYISQRAEKFFTGAEEVAEDESPSDVEPQGEPQGDVEAREGVQASAKAGKGDDQPRAEDSKPSDVEAQGAAAAVDADATK